MRSPSSFSTYSRVSNDCGVCSKISGCSPSSLNDASTDCSDGECTKASSSSYTPPSDTDTNLSNDDGFCLLTSNACTVASSGLDVETKRAGEARARQLVQLVESECGFLRLSGHRLITHTTEKAKRHGLAMTLRFYVHGLPSAKRAKWQQPLFRSVAAALQRCGCCL